MADLIDLAGDLSPADMTQVGVARECGTMRLETGGVAADTRCGPLLGEAMEVAWWGRREGSGEAEAVARRYLTMREAEGAKRLGVETRVDAGQWTGCAAKSGVV